MRAPATGAGRIRADLRYRYEIGDSRVATGTLLLGPLPWIGYSGRLLWLSGRSSILMMLMT